MMTNTETKATETTNWAGLREINRAKMAAERCSNAGQRYTMLAKAEAAMAAWRAANPVGAAEVDATEARYAAASSASRETDKAEADRLVNSGF
jgi:hypothetical protein